ncbi:hypothetical protein ACLIKD_05845 [Azonexus sp. IMCC34842]|uniref:hypothetical protein n=1 Tax=Azonexus sp. IMCC34842 TaxID=3420950 RepID=UPI003D10AA61
MDSLPEHISVRPQEGAGMFFILMPMLLVAFAISMAQMEINFIWWVPFEILFFIVLIYSLLMRPVEITFCSGSKRINVIYRFAWLTKKGCTFAFYDAESIQSRFSVTADNDPEVLLEITLKNHDRLVLMSAPDWSPSAPILGYSGCLEPQKLEALRQQIATLAGIKDMGFHR